jgi:hypothetical protein
MAVVKKSTTVSGDKLMTAFIIFFVFSPQLVFAESNTQSVSRKAHQSISLMQLDNETAECKRFNQTEISQFSSYDLFFQRQDHNSVPCKSINQKSILVSREQSIDILPVEAIKTIEKEAPDSYLGVVPFDLNADGIDEYIVRGGQPSGGTQFYFLQKQNKKWKLITYFSGGFVLSPANKLAGLNEKQKRYYKITYWHRYGMNDTWQYDLIYKNGEYQQHSELQIPIEVLHTHDFLERMRMLNGFLRLNQWN